MERSDEEEGGGEQHTYAAILTAPCANPPGHPVCRRRRRRSHSCSFIVVVVVRSFIVVEARALSKPCCHRFRLRTTFFFADCAEANWASARAHASTRQRICANDKKTKNYLLSNSFFHTQTQTHTETVFSVLIPFFSSCYSIIVILHVYDRKEI